MRIDDIEVEILIDGQPAKEYTDDDFEQEAVEDQMSKYILAVEGAHFKFRYTLYPSYTFAPAIDYLGFYFKVDGKKVSGKVMEKERISKRKTKSGSRDGYISKLDGMPIEEKFVFSNITTHDRLITNAETERIKKEFQEVGELRCEVWRKVGGSGFPLRGLNKAKDLSHVHQKAVVHRAVSMGAKKDPPVVYRIGANWEGQAADTKPIATFVFKYRDRGLQKLGVIERSPTPVPLEDRDPSTLTPDELREAMRRIQAREKEHLAKIKKEKQEAVLRHLAGSKRGRGEDEDEDDENEQVAEVENPNKKARVDVVEILDDD